MNALARTLAVFICFVTALGPVADAAAPAFQERAVLRSVDRTLFQAMALVTPIISDRRTHIAPSSLFHKFWLSSSLRLTQAKSFFWGSVPGAMVPEVGMPQRSATRGVLALIFAAATVVQLLHFGSSDPNVLVACGLFGVLWELDPSAPLWGQLKQIRTYLWNVLDAVASRGPQAAGITLFVQDRRGEVAAKRFRLLNPKRVALSKLMIATLSIYVLFLYLRGYKPLSNVEIYGHVRFATGGPPGVRETHMHRFGPPEKVDDWTFAEEGVIKRVVNNNQLVARDIRVDEEQIGHNGDLDEWFVYGRWLDTETLKLWLQRVFHLEGDSEVQKTKVDSFVVSGLAKILVAQRSWFAAVRFANAFYVAEGPEGPFPSKADLEKLAKPFEAVFTDYQDKIRSKAYKSFNDFTSEDHLELKKRLLAMPMPGIPDLKKHVFVDAAVYAFLFMDPTLASRFLMQRAKESPSNSFALQVITPRFPSSVTLMAYKQAISLAFDPSTRRVAWASEPQALAARQYKNGPPLPWRLDFRDELTEGEIGQITPHGLRLYSVALGREYTVEELRHQMRLIPNNETNPDWSSLPEPPAKGTRTERSAREIPMRLKNIFDSFNDPESENYKTSLAYSDLKLIRGIYKDIVYKSRVNRIEDYSTLAEEIYEKAQELLKRREANPSASEDDYRNDVRAFADQVFETVVAFDFIKKNLREVLVNAVKARGMLDAESIAAHVLPDFESRVERIADPALVSALRDPVKNTISTLRQMNISEIKGFEGHAEDLALQILDQAAIDPARLRHAYREGSDRKIWEMIKSAAKKGGRYLEEQKDTVLSAIRAHNDRPDSGMLKTMDRNDPDLVMYGHEISKEMAGHLASLYEKTMPGFHVVVLTGNELLESFNQPGGIERRKNDFRVHIRTEHGEYRFGKRTLVISVSQTFQTYPTKMPGAILRDLFNEYNSPNQFIIAGRMDTPGNRVVGQIPHPEAPRVHRIWSNMTGWKPEEPSTDVAAAFDFLMAGRIFPFDLWRLRQLFPTYPLFECKVTREEAERLWEAGNRHVHVDIPQVVGTDVFGQPLPNAGPANTLKKIAPSWALRIVEPAVTDIVTWFLISLVAFIHWAPSTVLDSLSALSHVNFSSSGPMANWLYFLPFMRWGVPLVVRLLQGRRLSGRRGTPTIALAMTEYVGYTLEQLVSTLISHQAYGGQGVNVHHDDTKGDFLARFAKRVTSATLIFLSIPDGRRVTDTVGKKAARMVATQASGIISVGGGPEVVAVGENLTERPKGATAHASLGTSAQNHLDPANNRFAELEESIYGNNKLLVSGITFFVTMALAVSRYIPWLRPPLDYTMVGRTTTTRSGIPAPNGSAGERSVDEGLPTIVKTLPIALHALVGLPIPEVQNIRRSASPKVPSILGSIVLALMTTWASFQERDHHFKVLSAA